MRKSETYTDLGRLRIALASLGFGDTASAPADLLDKQSAVSIAAEFQCWPMKDGAWFTFERI